MKIPAISIAQSSLGLSWFYLNSSFLGQERQRTNKTESTIDTAETNTENNLSLKWFQHLSFSVACNTDASNLIKLKKIFFNFLNLLKLVLKLS